ncbi:MAG: response regulator [Chloroflexota bacterium]
MGESNILMRASSASDQNRQRILVVDDEKFARNFVQHTLSLQGYEVVLVDSGENALKYLQETQQVDLILLDLLMVGLDGFDLLREIKKHPVMKDDKIIILSALDDEEDRQETLALGALDFIKKPINSDELIEKVQKYLKD